MNKFSAIKFILVLGFGFYIGTLVHNLPAIELKDSFLLILGVVLGVLAGLVPTFWLLNKQFEGGYAGHRMDTVVFATYDVASELRRDKSRNMAPIRNKYRYGMAVIAEELEQMEMKGDGLKLDGFKPDGAYPLLIGKDDRWERFNHYVRPIIDDVNAYTLLRTVSWFSTPGFRLGKLMDLCKQIEVIVMLCDALLDDKKDGSTVIGWKSIEEKSGDHLLLVGKPDDTRVQALHEELKKLANCWQDWKKAIGADKPQ